MVPFAALLLAQAIAPSPTPLSPNNKWEVNYADKDCMLAREFGPAEGKVLLGVSTLPFASGYTIKLISPGALTANRRKPVSFALDLRASEDDRYWTMAAPQKGTRLLTFGVSADALAGASDASVMRVTEPDGKAIALQAKGLKAGLKALSLCAQDLAATWGVDKAAISAVATPAKGFNEAEWITVDDYPATSLSASEEGKVRILWQIGVDGRVSNCRVVDSSGHPDLDQASCDAVTKRGRYNPAKDAQGKPVVSFSSRMVIWAIPH